VRAPLVVSPCAKYTVEAILVEVGIGDRRKKFKERDVITEEWKVEEGVIMRCVERIIRLRAYYAILQKSESQITSHHASAAATCSSDIS